MAGRKRKAGPRVNGRLKQEPRYVKAEDMQSVVREARERVFGLTTAQAAIVPETTELGRLLASGEISQRQYDAGSAYAKAVREHDRLLGTRGFPKAGNLDRGGGHQSNEESAEEAENYRTTMRRYDRCRAALRDAERLDRMAGSVVDAVCVSDWALPHMVGSLRFGLSRLAHIEGLALPKVDIRRELVQP